MRQKPKLTYVFLKPLTGNIKKNKIIKNKPNQGSKIFIH